jgi:hypothetical protein
MDREELLALQSALEPVLSWPDAVRGQVARWLAPNDAGGNPPLAPDTDKENNGVKDTAGGKGEHHPRPSSVDDHNRLIN